MKVKKKKRKQKETEKELQQKVGMFDKLPDACDACKKTFDKKDKSMIQSWNVVVREAEGIVRLYCPECWNAAIKAIEEVENG
tara:strand:- start:331 stop:576 length:246 start_codon:yes stop_codon:yes gene_type:complete